jgi:hypothetical protein
MTARNGKAEWHGNVESGSGAITVRRSRWLRLVLECLGSRDRVAVPAGVSGDRRDADLGVGEGARC